MEVFNNHGIRTVSNWSPYQLWLNGMMHEDNRLAKGELHEAPIIIMETLLWPFLFLQS
jgi:hypothetical protein